MAVVPPPDEQQKAWGVRPQLSQYDRSYSPHQVLPSSPTPEPVTSPLSHNCPPPVIVSPSPDAQETSQSCWTCKQKQETPTGNVHTTNRKEHRESWSSAVPLTSNNAYHSAPELCGIDSKPSRATFLLGHRNSQNISPASIQQALQPETSDESTTLAINAPLVSPTQITWTSSERSDNPTQLQREQTNSLLSVSGILNCMLTVNSSCTK